jgi:hypothetical protein
MEDRMTQRISVPKKSQRARDRVSEEIALEHIYKFFVRKNNTETIKKDGETTMVSFEAMNPKGNLMKDLRSLFMRTKVGGQGIYRSKLVELVSAMTEMSSTPDLALILQVIVWKNGILDKKKTRYAVAIVEVKRGNAKLSSDQSKDVEISKKRGIPYYLLRVDDSDFMKGNFVLKLELRTPSLDLLVPELATT